jgi:hypothetical protein
VDWIGDVRRNKKRRFMSAWVKNGATGKLDRPNDSPQVHFALSLPIFFDLFAR